MTLKKTIRRVPSQADCSNLSCPRDRQYLSGELVPTNPCNPLAIDKRNLSQDTTGRYWCQSPQCQKRYELMQYGAAHGFPLVQVDRYAIGRGSGFWLAALVMGNDDSIERYYTALIRPVDDIDAIDALLPDENAMEEVSA